MNLTQQRFLGYQNTPTLWNGGFLGLKQFCIEKKCIPPTQKINDTGRLGNYVERLVSYELSQDSTITILKENLQIIDNKTTLGELDCLLYKNGTPIHLEIAYKFYLYDTSVGTDFTDHWIGPNRRDSLMLKLQKMREKQFPLLHKGVCKAILGDLNLNNKEIQQQTLFKAQLFIPYHSKIALESFNEKALQGYYLNFNQLKLFVNSKFYIPRKLDWLIKPHAHVDWLTFDRAKNNIEEFHQKNSCPLCWVKHPNGEIEKVFVVNW